MAKAKVFTQSIERLAHFRCGLCGKYWSIGDAPTRDHWFCPWCGERLTLGGRYDEAYFEAIAAMDAEDKQPTLGGQQLTDGAARD